MRNKTVGMYSSGIQFVPDQYKTQKMCAKAVDACLFVFDSVLIDIRRNKSVIMLFLGILLCWNIASRAIRLNKCVIKLLLIFYQQ